MNVTRTFCVVLILLWSENVFGQQSVAQLHKDYLNQEISLREYVVNIGYAAFYPDRLPVQYKQLHNLPKKCAIEAVYLLKSNFDLLTYEEQELFKSFLSRPSKSQLPETYFSLEGMFKIHYTETGSDAVLAGDVNENNIPDFVEETGIALDRSYNFFIASGYQPPPVETIEGSEYDVYLANQGEGGVYGFTTAETDQPETPWFDPTSYIEMSNDFSDELFFTHGFDALRITVAHELHHAFQFGYNFNINDNSYFHEMTSTWFEDVLYDDVNDYLQYVPSVIGEGSLKNSLGNKFPISETPRHYGMSLFLHVFDKRFGERGPDLLVNIWENIRLGLAIDILEDVINESTESNFETEFHEFYVWNYFTGSHADTDSYYPDGDLYPDLVPNQEIDVQDDTTIEISTRELSSQYITFKYTLGATFDVELEIDPEDQGLWHISIILNDNSSIPQRRSLAFNNNVTGAVSLSSFSDEPELTVIATMTGKSPKIYGATISLRINEPPAVSSNLFPTIPSPANFNLTDRIKIPFEIDELDEVELRIYSLSGALVKSFPKVLLPPAKYENSTPFEWDGMSNSNKQVPSGIYIYILKGNKILKKEKMAVIR